MGVLLASVVDFQNAIKGNKMNDLQKELQALKAKVVELESRIVAEPVAKWEPVGGDYLIMSNGDTVKISLTSIDDTTAKLFGTKRDTLKQAERAAVEMRKFNRLLALRDEFCGDELVDWENGEEKYYLYYWNGDSPKWRIGIDIYSRLQTPYFTSYDLAQRACDMLNSGEVVL